MWWKSLTALLLIAPCCDLDALCQPFFCEGRRREAMGLVRVQKGTRMRCQRMVSGTLWTDSWSTGSFCKKLRNWELVIPTQYIFVICLDRTKKEMKSLYRKCLWFGERWMVVEITVSNRPSSTRIATKYHYNRRYSTERLFRKQKWYIVTNCLTFFQSEISRWTIHISPS